jgi:uncharacterized protein YwgA
MSQLADPKRDIDKAASVVRDAGGRVVGRTRLQKIAYLLEATGLGDGFKFTYRNFGPYSEELADATWQACLLGLLKEEERPASWGGSYSVFETASAVEPDPRQARLRLVEETSRADAIALELAATAAFLANEGSVDPWHETAKRKPEKAAMRMTEARALYAKLKSINLPRPLPDLK